MARARRLLTARLSVVKHRRGLTKVVRQGLLLAAAYGMRALGWTQSQLRRYKGGIAKLLNGASVRSTTLTLQMAGLGPTATVLSAPIVAWAARWWADELVEEMRQAWRNQLLELGLQPLASRVRDPAGACRMASK